MHICLYKFHRGWKYTAQIESNQAELRREEKVTDQKNIYVSSLQTEYLNLDSSSGYEKKREKKHLQAKFIFCEGSHLTENVLKIIKTRRKRRRMVIQTDNELSAQLANISDANF